MRNEGEEFRSRGSGASIPATATRTRLSGVACLQAHGRRDLEAGGLLRMLTARRCNSEGQSAGLNKPSDDVEWADGRRWPRRERTCEGMAPSRCKVNLGTVRYSTHFYILQDRSFRVAACLYDGRQADLHDPDQCPNACPHSWKRPTLSRFLLNAATMRQIYLNTHEGAWRGMHVE